MLAIVCRQFDALEQLTVEPWPDEAIADDQVRVAIDAAGVSFANTVVLAGRHQNTPELPFIPGTELCGTVIARGKSVCGIELGARVVASVPRGAFATHINIAVNDVYEVPHSVNVSAATSIPTLYGTAMGALKWRAKLCKGQTLLVLGSGSGTGLAAVDVGRMLGARVIACASSEEKLATAASRGAEHGINYVTENLGERVLTLTDGHGVDVIYDPVGGTAFSSAYRTLRAHGTALIIGFASGEVAPLEIEHLRRNNVSVSGFYWGYHLGIGRVNGGAQVRKATRALIGELISATATGQLQPLVSREFRLEQAPAALKAVRDRQVLGRVTLRIDDTITLQANPPVSPCTD